MSELAKKYDHRQVEGDDTYQRWIDEGYFTAGDAEKIPYTIVIPPPNVTGKLHLGHAWDTTLQDILSRYHRLRGYDVLWLPGMDHAGIATQAKIEERLAQEGTNRHELGREEFLKRAWQWKEEYADTIRKQWAKLGLSLDYSRERFTLDEGLSDAVQKVFTQLYDEGLIYQGKRIINWDPQIRTALSNIEVEHREIPGHMYYLRYPVVGSDEEVIIATTRPETMFADQAVFVHPDDERYQHLIGKKVVNPANGEELPVLADDYIDLDFGTAIMKCTPAHDPNDFELARKHNLDMPVCMNPDGTMNELAGEFEGLDRFEARKALMDKFEREGRVEKIEDHLHQVGHSQRSGVIVEPYLSNQWFVSMKPLAKAVLDAQKTDEKIEFVPARFTKTFEQWLENIEDWCISRQLWWGHRIPAWYNEETGEMKVQTETPGPGWVQDEDVLDTWFSSALWPFSTLGWPQDREDLERYFPTDVLVTGYDIIFFWVARMAFQSRHFMENRPFKEVLIHGLIRDKEGRKMSKSLGNGIDPMDVIDSHGADALRLFLTTNSAPGLDLRFDETKLDSSWNFLNKLWNASRFVQSMTAPENEQIDVQKLTKADKWILERLNKTVEQVTRNMDKYELSLAGNELFSFVWDDFCSWYLELAKIALKNSDTSKNTQAVLRYVLKAILILLSPFAPFASDFIYRSLGYGKESINLEIWPEPFELERSEDEKDRIEALIAAIQSIREIKRERSLKNRDEMEIVVVDGNQNVYPFDAQEKELIEQFAHVRLGSPDEAMELIPFAKGFIMVEAAKENKEEQREKLEKELAKLSQEIARASGMLNNPGFINKAPAKKVELERQKLADFESRRAILEQMIKEL